MLLPAGAAPGLWTASTNVSPGTSGISGAVDAFCADSTATAASDRAARSSDLDARRGRIMRRSLRHQPRPLGGVGVLLERDHLAVLEVIDVTELRVEPGAGRLDGSTVTPGHHDLLAAIDKRGRHHGKVVDRGNKTCEHVLANLLRPSVRVTVGKSGSLGLVPADRRIHRA